MRPVIDMHVAHGEKSNLRGSETEAGNIQGHSFNYPSSSTLAEIKAELAGMIPYRLSQKIGGFEFKRLTDLSEHRIYRLMTKPDSLHRFPDQMTKNLHAAINHIKDEYGGIASRIWKGKPSSADVVYRFLQFRGVGPKIATLATNILARDFKVPFSDYYSIDVSVDVHVRRVFRRLGFASVLSAI